MTSPVQEWLSQPDGLSARLQNARKRAGMTGMQMATHLGWSQSKISKIETGRQVPTEDDLDAWISACGVSELEARQLQRQLADLQTMHRKWQSTRRTGQAPTQRSYDQLARDAARIRNFEVLVIPGLLQTPDYARYRLHELVALHGFEADEVDAALAARMRRQEVLYDTSKVFEFVVTEAALRILLCPPAVMTGQLDRLLTVSQLPNVLLGVIPLGVQLSVEPQNRFVLFDDLALVETFTGESAFRGDEAEAYQEVMDRLLNESVTGTDARRLILRATDELSSTTPT